MNLKLIREQNGLKGYELAKAVGTDASMISRFENYKCLPTPETMDGICRELSCGVADIYEPIEITYKIPESAKRKKPKPADKYRLTVDLPAEAQEFLSRAIRKCGYKDITNWVTWCYERLQAQYRLILQKEKNLASAADQCETKKGCQ